MEKILCKEFPTLIRVLHTHIGLHLVISFKHLVIVKEKIVEYWAILGMGPYSTHYHFTRLNPKKKGTLQFCLPALQGIHRHPMQKEFFRSTEGFLRAALTGHGHPGPL